MKKRIIQQAIALLENLDAETISDIQVGTFDMNGNEHTSIDIVIKKDEDAPRKSETSDLITGP